jgi:Flp pilus assembly pilin Flp
MNRQWRRLSSFWAKEEGVTTVECALMLALVVVICLVAIQPFGHEKASAADIPMAVIELETEAG